MIITIDTQERLDQIREINKKKAEDAFKAFISEMLTNMMKSNLEVPVEQLDEAALMEYAELMYNDINNPPISTVYTPPLPPGVAPPPVAAITAHITREPGWNSVLGYRITLIISDSEYVPANLALSIYSAANCTNYQFTTGAFQYDDINNQYYSVCPAGFEPGDADVHMGLLYGSAPLSCWTLSAGTANIEILIYGGN